MTDSPSNTAALRDLAEQILDIAKSAGADAADAMVVQGVSQTVSFRNGALEQAERSEGTEMGLRVMVGQRQACVSVADLRPDTLRDMAARAVTMARLAPEDPTVGLADPAQLSPMRDASGLELSDDGAAPLPAEMEDEARRAEAAARAVPKVTQIQSSNAGYSHRTIFLAASNGFAGGYARSDYGLSCVAISGEGTGMERDYYGD
ncbi:MAG: PmbA/TldA family metallopeptidase, partial [Paracoccaceae bacterium]